MNSEKVALISCDAEFCAARRGGSLGPGALLTAARQEQDAFLLGLEQTEVHHNNRVLHHSPLYPHAKYLEAFLPVFRELSRRVADHLKAGYFPLCLTGDHAQGGALLHGVKQAFPEARLGAVWIDAHADLHSPFTTPSGNVHGMPLAMSLAQDNLNQRRNVPSPEVVEMWSELKAGPGGEPVLLPEDLVFIGIRSIEPEEEYLIRNLGIRCLDVAESRRLGMAEVIRQTLRQLEPCDLIFVSFDVDSMDPERVSDGTGTPVPGGFTEQESTDLLQGLLTSDKVKGMEITEINPTLDTAGNKMGEVCLRILKQCFHNRKENAALVSA